MKHLAAYLLLTIGGNESPSAQDVKKVLSSVDIESDDARVEKLISELQGKSMEELIATGSSKLASVPSAGGAAAAAPSGGAPAAAAAASAAPAAAKKEEPAAKEEESDDDMGFGLFD